MDLSEDSDAAEYNVCTNVEGIEEARQCEAACSQMPPVPDDSQASFQLELITTPTVYGVVTSDAPLNETNDEEMSYELIDSDPQAVQVEADDMIEHREPMLKPELTDTVCDSEESSEFSTTVLIGDDNCVSVRPTEFGAQLEECGSVGDGLVEDESVGVRDSQQFSCELGSCSQSPMSFVVQLNEDSECSLQSLPPGESGPTNFGMKLSSLVHGDSGKSYITGLGSHVIAAEYLDDSSRCSQDSERMPDEPDLLMEVETGSTFSEAVSVQDVSTAPYTITASASSTRPRKSTTTGRSEDRNKSRIRKRVMIETAGEIEDRFVRLTYAPFVSLLVLLGHVKFGSF